MKFRLSLLSLTFSLCSAALFAQGPIDGFYKGKGHVDIGLGANMETSSEFFAGTSTIGLGRDITALSFFALAGITDKLDAQISVPYLKINDVQGLQDGSIYLKYRALEKAFNQSKLSFTIAAGASSNLSDYETEGGSAIGQQAKSFDLRPLIHYQLYNGLFLTAQAGYQWKSNPTPDALQASIKLGYAAPKYYLDLWYAYQGSDGGLDYRGETPVNSFKQLGVDYDKAGLTFFYPFSDKLGAYVNGSYILSGRNISQTTGYGLGLVWKVLP